MYYYGSMVKLSNEKRLFFKPNKQRGFIEKMQQLLNLDTTTFAKIAKVSTRTVRDWKREAHSVPLNLVMGLCKTANIDMPNDTKIRDQFWYVKKGARMGGIASHKRHGHVGGNPNFRKKKWHEWWKKEGKFKANSITKPLPISIPKKSIELAEFIGIVLGDGGITKKQVTITVHKIDDEYYAKYIKKLIKKLFSINPACYIRKNVFKIVISRSKLVKALLKMGLHMGNKVKHQIDVPIWIKKSNMFSKACLRGLFDTDGCFYIDRHKYKDKIYLNCGINFTNRSLPLLNFFKSNLTKTKLNPTQKTDFSVFLRREEDVLSYFKVIGSSNQKHLNKFRKYFKNKYGEVPKWS